MEAGTAAFGGMFMAYGRHTQVCACHPQVPLIRRS